MKNIILLAVLFFSVNTAFADCDFGGVSYKTGAVVGGFVCTASGRWVKN